MNDERIDFEKLSKAMSLFIKFVKYVDEELNLAEAEKLLDDIGGTFEKEHTEDGENDRERNKTLIPS